MHTPGHGRTPRPHKRVTDIDPFEWVGAAALGGGGAALKGPPDEVL